MFSFKYAMENKYRHRQQTDFLHAICFAMNVKASA